MQDFPAQPDINITVGAPKGLLGANAIVSNTYKDQAYRLIKDAIIYKNLKLGNVYSQDILCAELKISRTPVREALLELQKEGYISILRGKGIYILPVTKEEAQDIIEMRYHVEALGCQLAAARRNEQDLQSMLSIFREMEACKGQAIDFVMLYRLDRQFHLAIFEAAKNKRMQQIIEQLRDNFLRVEDQTAFAIEPVIKEHRAIYQAILDASPEAARHAMQIHMENSKKRTMTHVLDALPDNEI